MLHNYLLRIRLLLHINLHHGIIYLPDILRSKKELNCSSSLREKRYLNLVCTKKIMIQPIELRSELPMVLSNNVVSTTTKVWDILVASKKGDLETVKKLGDECHELLFAQYNYTPPIHFAVREGHVDLVKYLLNEGALDPTYFTYPFHHHLSEFAEDRGHVEIEKLLKEYVSDPGRCKFKGDNG